MKLEMKSRQRWATLTATLIWGLAVAIGFLALRLHGASPGQSGPAVERWPGRSRIPLSSGRPTLVVAVHPLCPCTRASVAELARLLTQVRGPGRGLHSHLPSRACRPWLEPDSMACAVSATMPGVHLTRRSRRRRSGPLRRPDFRSCCVLRSRWATPFPRRNHGCPGPRGR